MAVSTNQLFIILLGAGTEEDSYVFCLNRSIDSIAVASIHLKEVEGVKDYLAVTRNHDDNGDPQVIIEVLLEGRDDMPAVFGRIAIFFAGVLNVPFTETLLFREMPNEGTDDARPMSFMYLTDFTKQFPSTLASPMQARSSREDEILAQLEAQFNSS